MHRHAHAAAFAVALSTLAFCATPARALLLDFEDLGANLPIDGNAFYDGRSAWDPDDPDATDFQSQGATFNNDFTEFFPGCCWQGFAYSQVTDTATSGPGNQYSAVTGSGVGGSDTYGIGFTGAAVGASDIVTITLGSERIAEGGWFTNTTWAADSMSNGDGFAKAFGGESGDDEDWFVLSITGFDATGVATGTVEFFLADYRFADNEQDYIVDEWTWVDLSSLGAVKSLDFSVDSTDAEFGFLNNPAYFAMDDLLLVPEPGTGVLLALGLAGLAGRGRVTRPRRECRSRSRRSPAPR